MGTKKSNEMMAHTYRHVYGLSFVGLRFFTVYGPWGRPDMAAFSFAKRIVKGEPLKIFQGPGASELERDFTYIDDIVKGCVAAVDKITPSTKETAMCQVYNLGNKDPVTVSYLVDCLEKALGKKAIRNYMPMPPTGDVLQTSADVTKAGKELGYQPTTPLQDGIKKFIAWYQDYYKEGMDKDMDEYVPMRFGGPGPRTHRLRRGVRAHEARWCCGRFLRLLILPALAGSAAQAATYSRARLAVRFLRSCKPRRWSCAAWLQVQWRQMPFVRLP